MAPGWTQTSFYLFPPTDVLSFLTGSLQISFFLTFPFRYHRDAATQKDELIKSLDQSVAIQDEDVYISESVQSGLLSKTYDVGRYAPGVEMAAHHFHLLISRATSKYLYEEAAKLSS